MKMSIILVVDDSEVDRRVVAALLEKNHKWIVETANDGESALGMMETVSPDIVITDMMMPIMNGMELVCSVKAAYPHVPIVLMTGQGNETLAVEALKNGAASYIPKSALSEYLTDTVEQLLQMTDLAQSQDRLLSHMSRSQFQFNLTTEPKLIPSLVRFVGESMANHEFGDEAIRRHASVAIQESLINAMFHGNLELSSAQVQAARRDLHTGEFSKLVQQRSQEKPFDKREILVLVDIRPTMAQFIVRDEGRGFNVKQLPAVDDLDNISSPKVGRGLTLIGQLMDRIEFNSSGTEIRMTLLDSHDDAEHVTSSAPVANQLQ